MSEREQRHGCVIRFPTPLFLIFPTHLRVLHDEAELRVRERYWGLVLVPLLWLAQTLVWEVAMT